MSSVGKITKYWLILFEIEVKQIILFDLMTGKKLIKGHILKILFCKRKVINFRML
jgi:predicted RNA-binding protein